MKAENKIDWIRVAHQIARDKKRIEAFKNTASEAKIKDIRFVIPAALRIKDCRK